MKPRPANLDQIERWMHSVITHPHGVEGGLRSAQASEHLAVSAEELESVITRSRSLSAHERLGIYVDAYYERLMECLREEFPATREAAGGEFFDALAFGYLQHHPSRSYTLARLGSEFPRFLADSRLHARAVPEGAGATWCDWIIELATFERLLRDVFDAEGTEGREPVDLGQAINARPDDWGRLRLVAAPCLRLAQFGHAVHDFWSRFKSGEAQVEHPPETTYLALYRRDYSVRTQELGKAQFVLLDRLMQGQSLQQSIAAAAGPDLDHESLAQQLHGWFARWARERFFVAVH